MGLEVRWTGYGRPAAAALHRAVADAKGGDPLAPVTVVVPSNHVGVASRRLLASGELGPVAGVGAGLAAVSFLTVYRLAELLGAASLAGQGRRPVSTPVLATAVRAELAEAPGVFEPVRDHPATEAALVATYRELRDLSDGALDAVARQTTRAADVVRLHRSARSRLAERWSDEEDLLDAAAAAAATDPARAARDLGALVVHLPQRLSRHGGRLLAALAEHLPTTIVAGTTGQEAADAEVRTSLARLGVPDSQLGAPPVDPPGAVDRTTVVTASDADEEVRAAVRAVVDAARSGTRLDRIAVLHASPEPYARLAHEQLTAAGIATNGAAVVPLSARIAGRTLLELLALPAARFRRQDVMAWLTAAPILAGDRWAPVAAWERISRDAAVVAGRDQWDRLLLQHAEQQEHRAERAGHDDDQPDWIADRARTTARRARSLRTFVLGLIADLGVAATEPRRWSEHAAWARRTLARLLGGPGQRAAWPEVEQRSAERVEQALDRLGALDAVEGAVPLEVFARTLEVELEDDPGRVGRFGDGVLVGSVEMGIGIDLDLVVVLGMAEGSFPATVRDDSLLPDRERTAAAGELALRADRVDRQHRQLLGALAGAGRHVLCVPRGDLRRSAERVPSRWVLDLATHLDGASRRWWAADLLGASEPWVRDIASFEAGLRATPVPATDQEHRLRALLANGGDLADLGDARARSGAEVVAARRSSRFTRFDGNLAGLPIPSPVDGVMSPTRLERWAGCPHAHLVLDLLGATPVENPEDELVITPIDRGNLVHEALEAFVAEVLARPHGPPGPHERWTPADHRRLQEIGASVCESFEARGLVGRPIFWRRDRRRILADLDTALLLDGEHRAAHGTSPLAVELAFGFDGADPVPFPLPDGRALRIRGRADRVDVAADGSLHVLDYKTGGTRGYGGLGDDPVVRGTKLQLPVYGLAGRLHHGTPDAPVRAEYWFVTRKGGFERIGYEVTDDVLAATSSVLGTIVTGIEAGVFPAHPDEHTSTWFRVSCDACDPDGLGTTELRRQWERKRHDPALAPYAELAEPLEPDDEGAAA